MTVDDFYTTYPLPLGFLHGFPIFPMEFVKDPGEAEASAAGKMAAEAHHEKVPLIVHGVCMHGCFLI